MSYILDALRRADAERGRAGVPGLHTRSVPPVSGDEGRRKGAQPFVWMGLGAAVVAAGAAAWSFMVRNESSQDVALTSATPVSTLPVGAAPTPHTGPAQAAAADPTQVMAAAPTPSAPVVEAMPAPRAAPPVPAAPPPEPSPAERSAGIPVSRPAAVKPSPEALPAPVTRTAAPRARAPQDAPARSAPAPAEPQERVYALHELPESLRRAMPPLDIGGSIYSATPASRFLIINGQIYHEGDSVTPEVTLEEIRLRAAVLRFRDRRVQVTY
jgi:general secretion pathway protein B